MEATFELLFARILNVKTAVLIGSPGPFKKMWRLALAKLTLLKSDLVTTREPYSSDLLGYVGIAGSHIHSTACPSVCSKADYTVCLPG